MADRRENFSSGSTFEDLYGYSRAVRVGDQVWVAGTTGYDYASMTLPDDPAAQTRHAIGNIERALRAAGAGLADVVQLTTWMSDGAFMEAIGPVLGEAFGVIRPTNAAIVSGFPFPGIKVEIAAIAWAGCGAR